MAGAVFSKLAGEEVRDTERGSDLVDALAKLGPLATNAVLKTAGANPEYLTALYTVYPDISDIVPPRYEARKLAGDLFFFEYGQKLPSGIPAEKLAEIRLRGWTLVDKRPQEETGRIHEIDLEQLYGTPDKPGVYKVQLTEGRTEECIVVPTQTGFAVISEDGDKSFTASSDILCARLDGMKDLPSGSPLISIKEMAPKRDYVLVHPNATDGYVFECQSVSTKDGTTRAKIWCSSFVKHGSNKGTSSNPRSLVTLDYPSSDLRIAGETCGDDTLYVPDDWKVIELDRAERKERDSKRNESEYPYPIGESPDVDADPEFRPGSKTAMVQKLASIGYRDIDVVYDGEFRVADSGQSTSQMSERQAACHLAYGYKLAVDQVSQILTEAKKCRGGKKGYKLAPPEKQAQVQYNHPDMPMPIGMTDYGVPLQTDVTNIAQSQTMSPEMPTGNEPWAGAVEPNVMLPQESQQLAQQASDMGQRKLFDHATIGGLAKLYDVTGLIDQMIPKLKTSIDALGRLLFLIQWKRDEFAERFGEDDTGELQALVRTVFRSFGDLVLQLEKTSVSDQERTRPSELTSYAG